MKWKLFSIVLQPAVLIELRAAPELNRKPLNSLKNVNKVKLNFVRAFFFVRVRSGADRCDCIEAWMSSILYVKHMTHNSNCTITIWYGWKSGFGARPAARDSSAILLFARAIANALAFNIILLVAIFPFYGFVWHKQLIYIPPGLECLVDGGTTTRTEYGCRKPILTIKKICYTKQKWNFITWNCDSGVFSWFFPAHFPPIEWSVFNPHIPKQHMHSV